jgi:hypothetical protein
MVLLLLLMFVQKSQQQPLAQLLLQQQGKQYFQQQLQVTTVDAPECFTTEFADVSSVDNCLGLSYNRVDSLIDNTS